MADAINAFFQFFDNKFGLPPEGVGAIAIFAVLVVAVIALIIYTRLKKARKIIERLAERLGYEPPFGDGDEILEEVERTEVDHRDNSMKAEQLEIRIGELEATGQHKDENFAALQQHSQELEEKLRQAQLQNDALEAQMGAQSKAHRTAVEQLEQRMRDNEAESNNNLTALHHRSKELEEQLQQAFLRNDKVMALANDQAQAHQRTVEQFDQRVRDVEAENDTKLTALQRRAKELEEQLRHAAVQNETIVTQATEQIQGHRQTIAHLEGRLRQVEGENEAGLNTLQGRAHQFEEQMKEALRQKDEAMAQAGEQTQAHREIVAQLEERIRNVDGENRGNLTALQQRLRELEEQLQQVYQQRDQVMAQAGEQAQAHRETLAKVEQHIREIEAQNRANLSGLEQRGRELEEQLQQAAEHHERIMAQASEQAQAHRETVTRLEGHIRQMEGERSESVAAQDQRIRDLEEQTRQAIQHHERIAVEAGEQAQAHRESVAQLEGRIRQMESEGDANLSGLQQHARNLEEQLQQAALHHERVAAQAGEQAQAHGETVAQLEGHIRQLEGERNEGLSALQQRVKDLDEQLERATIRSDQVTAQAGEQLQAYRTTVEKLEQRIRAMETEGNASLTALHQRGTELAEQLLQANAQREDARRDAQERAANMEQTAARIRDAEAERDARESQLQGLQANIKDLESQLQQAASREGARDTEQKAGAGTAEELLQRAEWIVSCAVGPILQLGLVAAEAYASAALAANPQGTRAPQLLAELARIRRAYPEGLPSVVEAVTTFDEKAAAFFAADAARAVKIADDEAQRRYRAGLNRSALLVTGMALQLRQKTDAVDSPETLRLLEMRGSLLARLGGTALASNPG